MAEGLLRAETKRRGCDIQVSSVGTWAHFGYPAMPESVEVLADRGIDLSEHRSRPVDVDELAHADVVVAMTSVHVRELLEIAPEIRPKVVLMKELVEIALEGQLPDSSEDRLARLLGAPRPQWRRALDLDDPIGKPRGAYEKTMAEIELGITVLLDALCGPMQGDPKAPS